MKQMKKFIVIFLAVLVIATCFPLQTFAKRETNYSVGSIIQYGSYPQSKVTNLLTLNKLNRMNKRWVSYGYYSGSGEIADGKMAPADYMWYCDLDTNGDGFRDYRAVKIDKYRQWYTGGMASDSISYQFYNGYTQGEVYYFKFEPISWRVLDPNDGLILTEKIMDCQAYNNYVLKSGFVLEDDYDAYYGNSSKSYYVNDYYNSSIRKWLNDDFYNTAFNNTQAKNIRNDVIHNNDCCSSSHTQYNSQVSRDKMFLLSYDEAKNSSFGFSSSPNPTSTRCAEGTEYAKSQGLYIYASNPYKGNSWWWLRTSDYPSNFVCGVNLDGDLNYSHYAYGTYEGIRVACRLFNLESDTAQSKIGNDVGSGLKGGEAICSHDNTMLQNQIDATCIVIGYTGDVVCSACGEIIAKGEVIATTPHTDSDNDGICDDCGMMSTAAKLNWFLRILKAIHKFVLGVLQDVTNLIKGIK